MGRDKNHCNAQTSEFPSGCRSVCSQSPSAPSLFSSLASSRLLAVRHSTSSGLHWCVLSQRLSPSLTGKKLMLGPLWYKVHSMRDQFVLGSLVPPFLASGMQCFLITVNSVTCLQLLPSLFQLRWPTEYFIMSMLFIQKFTPYR